MNVIKKNGVKFTIGKTSYSYRHLCDDIDVGPDVKSISLESLGPRGMSKYSLKHVHKQFPNVEELYIGEDVTEIEISNFMFPNVKRVISKSRHFETAPVLIYHRYDGDKVLLNTFCKQPDEIINMKGIKCIEAYAFEGCKTKQVVNTKEVTRIDISAFSGSVLLLDKNNNSVTMADSILVDINDSFDDIVLPDDSIDITQIYYDCKLNHVKSITVHKFETLRHMKYRNRPKTLIIKSLEYIDAGEKRLQMILRGGANGLENIVIDEANPYYMTVDGIIYSKDMKRLICCPIGKKGEVVIPEGVEIISASAFKHCRIDSVKFANSLRIIGDEAFASCANLQHIDFGTGLTYLGNGIHSKVFCNCKQLKKVEIPGNIKEIGGYAFHCCNSLTSIVLHEGLERINESAFSCNGFQTIKQICLPDSLESVADNNFHSVCEIYANQKLPESFLAMMFEKNPSEESVGIMKKSDNNDSVIYAPIFEVHIGEKITYFPKYINDLQNAPDIDFHFVMRPDDTKYFLSLYEQITLPELKQDAAIYLYQKTQDKDIRSYLRRTAKNIAKRYIADKNEEDLIKFLQLNITTKKTLQNTLDLTRKNNMVATSAYILKSLRDSNESNTTFKL